MELRWLSSADVPEAAEGFAAIVPTAGVARMMRGVLGSGGRVLAALEEERIVGWLTVCPFLPIVWRGQRVPRAFEESTSIVELGGLEVARPHRRRRVATRLLQALDDEGAHDDFIVVGQALVHHWDLAHERLAPHAYAVVLQRALRHGGFTVVPTNDPEIAEHRPSFLAARIGARASAEARAAFLSGLDGPI